MAGTGFQIDPTLPNERVWQRGWFYSILAALAFILLVFLTLGVAGIGIGLLMSATIWQSLFGIATLALAGVLTRMGYLSFRVIQGVGPAEIRLYPDGMRLLLPSWRSIIHRPPKFEGFIPYTDISSVETRLESYGGQVERTSRLVFSDGQAIFLFDEGFASGQQWAASYQPLVEGIADAAGAPLLDRGMVEGKALPLMAWSAKPVDWDAKPASPERARKIWQHARLIGAVIAVVTAIAIVGQAFSE